MGKFFCSVGRRREWADGPSWLRREPNNRLSAKIFSNFFKNQLKIVNNCKKSQKLNMTLNMLCIDYKKVVVVKLKFKFL
jgi:hypothetical protein